MAFLDRERSVAGPGFSRWLVPPAALAVHLSIGQIYAYSVFNEPMSRLLGGAEAGLGDWSLVTIGWIFSIALAVLGASAAIFGSGSSASARARRCSTPPAALRAVS